MTRCARIYRGTLGSDLHKCTGGRFCKGTCSESPKDAQKRRIEESKRKAREVVATGKCPDCGQPLVRNSAMAGWWQCSGYGAEGFRAAGSVPCSFQTFTE